MFIDRKLNENPNIFTNDVFAITKTCLKLEFRLNAIRAVISYDNIFENKCKLVLVGLIDQY